jgi:ATP-dependent exoDNAse (exonuclease V) beta subunit
MVLRNIFGKPMFSVLHSSAGAGKTHALVKNYLLLALGKRDPSTYTHILALTFTNKAAAEMRERVLLYLEALAAGTPLHGAQADLRNALLELPSLSPSELQHRAKAMLAHVLHHWPQFAVSTIDSFIRRVVMPFTRDLGLDQELNMTTEEDFLRDKAVDLLLEEAGSDKALTEVLVLVCEQLLEEERSWRPDQPLRELSKQLGKEQALEHLAGLREMDSAQFLEVRKRLREQTAAFRERMQALGRRALEAIAKAGLAVQDLANGKNGFISYLHKLAKFDDWFEKGSNVEKALANDKWHSGTASPSARAAIDALAPLFRDTIQEVEDLRWTEMRDYFIRLAIMRDLLSTATLNSIDQRLEALKQEEGLSFFNDLTRKVLEVVQEEPVPFLFERLGERYSHFLIDEFQDTSLMQWHALLPLVENALASGGSVLLVGDAKQAIYRWRNGEARQFTEFPHVFAKEKLGRGNEIEAKLRSAYGAVQRLDANYRSARNIIEFNNGWVDVLKLGLDQEGQKVYEEHAQQLVRDAEGYVEVTSFVKDEEGKDPWSLMVNAVKDCLEDGFRPGDIAVLVRSGKQGMEAARRLAAEGWRVVSPSGMALGGNPAVNAIVGVLAWLDQPVDECAAIAAQAVAVLVSPGESVDPFANGTKPQEYMRRWMNGHPRIHMRLPLVALICRIAQALRHDPAGNSPVMALVDEAQAFTRTSGDDLPGFLEQWQRTIGKRPIGGNTGPDTIQVMTVHKSKGLQFPVVIVPEVGKRSGGGRGESIWITPDPPMEGLRSALVECNARNGALGIAELEAEKRMAMLDDLDVLYVACTRPEERLYISVASSGNEVLAKALRDHLQLQPGQTWNKGTRLPHQAVHRLENLEAASFMITTGRASGDRTLAIRKEAPANWDPADPDPFRSHGRAVHAILARVGTAADLPRALAMESAVWSFGPSALMALNDQLSALLAKPGMELFFRDGLEVRTESTLIDADGHAHRPDRVVRDGNVFRVLDIKTGTPAEHHNDQVKGYMALLQAVEGVPVEGVPVEGWLLYVRDGELVPVQ